MSATAYVGRQARILLWDKGFKNKELAARLGITESTLSKKLKGERPWTIEEVLTIAEFLDVSLSELLPVTSEYLDEIFMPIAS